jgi:thiamine biosynthesis protein ThiI
MDGILIAYGELFLKSEPVRRRFETKLLNNMKFWLKKNKIEFKVQRKRSRIFVETKKIEEACEVLRKIFGIVRIAPCYRLKTSDLREIQKFCEENYPKWIRKNETFAVRARRVGKHEYTSQDLAKAIGDVIRRKVNLSNPDKEIFVEVRDNDCYIYTETIEGYGGLPLGTSGKVVSLISGGIDSPVSSWLMMKKGCKVVLLHFHSFPLVSKASIEKTKELAKVLAKYQRKIKIYLVPFQEIQMEIKTRTPARYRIVLYRRFMFRIAEEIAKLENAKALVTGESLAQVSSQTLPNLMAIEEVTKLPILRPLIGMDKVEIVNLAKEIGTYEISIKPQEDCCTLFIPKHPTTRAKIEIVHELEKKLKVKKLVKNAIKNVEIIMYNLKE